MGRQKKNTDEVILHEIYRRAFKASTPSGDWDELLINATINERGEKVIPFMDYECEQEVMEQILKTTLMEFKVPKWRRRLFETTFWLGCSPKNSSLKTETPINQD